MIDAQTEVVDERNCLTLQVAYQGKPAGEASIVDDPEGGSVVVWTRPDGVSERRDYPNRWSAAQGLSARLCEWYAGLQ